MAEEDLDFVVLPRRLHLRSVAGPRPRAPARRRRSRSRWTTIATATRCTRRDPDLQAAHAALPVARDLGRPRGVENNYADDRSRARPTARVVPRAARRRPTRRTTSTCRCGRRGPAARPHMQPLPSASLRRPVAIPPARRPPVPHASGLRGRAAAARHVVAECCPSVCDPALTLLGSRAGALAGRQRSAAPRALEPGRAADADGAARRTTGPGSASGPTAGTATPPRAGACSTAIAATQAAESGGPRRRRAHNYVADLKADFDDPPRRRRHRVRRHVDHLAVPELSAGDRCPARLQPPPAHSLAAPSAATCGRGRHVQAVDGRKSATRSVISAAGRGGHAGHVRRRGRTPRSRARAADLSPQSRESEVGGLAVTSSRPVRRVGAARPSRFAGDPESRGQREAASTRRRSPPRRSSGSGRDTDVSPPAAAARAGEPSRRRRRARGAPEDAGSRPDGWRAQRSPRRSR